MGIVAGYAVPHPPLIVPAVGRGEERAIQDTIDAYERIAREVVAAKPEVLIVTSPHAPLFRDAFHVTTSASLPGDMGKFYARFERIDADCDVAFAERLMEVAGEQGIPTVSSRWFRDGDMDHATFVPLYFVREAYKQAADVSSDLPCPIVRIGLSGLGYEAHRALGKCIARVVAERNLRAVFIASGDLSHKLKEDGPYGFAPEGPVFDSKIGDIFSNGKLDELFKFDPAFAEAAAECGLCSFQIMAGALEEQGSAYSSELLSLEGPFGVGYGVGAFRIDVEEAQMRDERVGGRADSANAEAASADEPDAPCDDACLGEGAIDPCIALARLSVETYVRSGLRAALPDDVPSDLLNNRAGVFVSLHEDGDLRGCIGTIGPTTASIAQEILQNGISAAVRDPRVLPVTPDELDYLEYSVDVLAQAEDIESMSELDVRRFGVIVSKGLRRGLLLPNLEGVDTVEDQVAIAKQKAGISVRDNDVHLQRFEVVRHTAGGEPRARR